MGFLDSIKGALGAEKDVADAASVEPASPQARHVDRDAPEESAYHPEVTGGKHRA
jgi:hypothetical protein